MFERENDNNYYVNTQCGNNIEYFVPSFEAAITFRDNGVRAKKACLVCAERFDFKSVIQIRITEKTEQRSMYISTIDNSSTFAELKRNQSLHVPFAGFVENLTQLLKECQAGKLELSLVRSCSASDANVTPMGRECEYELQFVEPRPFKNIVHLALPARQAPLNVVLFYVSSLLDAQQQKNVASEQAQKHLEMELNARQRTIEHLEAQLRGCRDKCAEHTKTLSEHSNAQLLQAQASLKRLTEQRSEDAEQHSKAVAKLQTQLDRLSVEKTQLLTEKEQDARRLEALREELSSTNARISALKEHSEKLNAEVHAMKSYERKQDAILEDYKRQNSELQEANRRCAKAQASIAADLEAEKKILHTKRQALEMATEEISKANQIIHKQSQEIAKQKRTIDLRTEVALHQERAMRQKEQSLALCKAELDRKTELLQALQTKMPQQLDSLRTFAGSIEDKYAGRIKELQLQLKSLTS